MLKQVTILGKRWRFTRKPLRTHFGFVDGKGPETIAASHDQTHREIVVDSTLSGEAELRYILHEFLHAADWHKSEEWVDEVSKDAARFLTRLGYKKEAQ